MWNPKCAMSRLLSFYSAVFEVFRLKSPKSLIWNHRIEVSELESPIGDKCGWSVCTVPIIWKFQIEIQIVWIIWKGWIRNHRCATFTDSHKQLRNRIALRVFHQHLKALQVETSTVDQHIQQENSSEPSGIFLGPFGTTWKFQAGIVRNI